MRRYLLVISCLAVTACGGGGSSGSSSTPTSSVPSVPTLSTTLAASSASRTPTDVDSVASFAVDATYTGSSSDPIVAVLDYDKTYLTLDSAPVQNGQTFTAKFSSVSGLAAGSYRTTIGIKLCKESSCTTVYPGSTTSLAQTIDIEIDDWSQRQRNAAHSGFVHATFDPAKFAVSWQYRPSNGIRFREMSATKGSIFATGQLSEGSRVVTAINATSGAERWHYSLGNISDASGPSFNKGRLYVASMSTSSGNNPLLVVDAQTGQFVRNLPFAAQWSTFAAPTVMDDGVYLASGYYGNVVYAWNPVNLTASWTANGSKGNTWDGEAPAADGLNIYYYSGALDVIDRTTGEIVKSINDPFWTWNGYSYGGTPMIAGTNNVVAYSGNGQGTYNVAFPLVSYDITAGSYRWRTASGYTTIPAAGGGKIYAGSTQTAELDAIDAATGEIAWAWPQPAGETISGNIVVTDNLLFVSTDRKVYAIDLTTHATVWSAATPGLLAIGPDAQLLVASTSSGVITAYSLR